MLPDGRIARASEARSWGRRRVTVSVARDGEVSGSAAIETETKRTLTGNLRRGLVAELSDGREIRLHRNGTRLRSLKRVIEVEGPGVSWECRGHPRGVRMIDVDAGKVILCRRVYRLSVDLTISDDDVLALLVHVMIRGLATSLTVLQHQGG